MLCAGGAWPKAYTVVMTGGAILTQPVEVRLTHSVAPCRSTIKLVSAVDVDVDSDNTNRFGPPLRSWHEEYIENSGYPATNRPGKIVCVNDNDDDNDGIPDYADGFNWDGIPDNADDLNPAENFVPIVIEFPDGLEPGEAKLRISYECSDPAGVTTNGMPARWIRPAEGKLRIWKKDGGEKRNMNSVTNAVSPGDYVGTGVYDDLTKLGFSDTVKEITQYIEGIRRSAAPGDQRIKVEMGPKDIAGFPWSDTVRVTGLKADLAGDINMDGRLDDNDEPFENVAGMPGLLTGVNNNIHTNAAGETEVDYADNIINGADDRDNDLKIMSLALKPRAD